MTRTMAVASPGFVITCGKGFHITLANGCPVSVQFGPGNYCENYDREIGKAEADCGRDGSADAEVAWWRPGGALEEWPGGDTVAGRQSPDEVVALLARVAAL